MKYLVTIGTFDGVHLGHRKLMRWVMSRARRLGLGTRVVLFAEPPRFYFRPALRLPLLTTSQERVRMLRELGIDQVEVLRFGPRWASMPHTRFFEEYLCRRWKAGGVLVGKDFAFGRGRKGDLRYLAQACAERGMEARVFPLVRVGGRKISSSRIRELLERGEAARAAGMLGRPHAVSGRVVRGRGLGSKIGVPTANLRPPDGILLPRGVFHVRVHGAGFRGRDGVCNVGTRPTLGGGQGAAVPEGASRFPLAVGGGGKLAFEIHIPGFSGSLYGRTLTIEFLRRIRAERRFPSLEALKRQIARDIRAIRG